MTGPQRIAYLSNADYALNLAEKLFPEETLADGTGDAFRYSLFSALNTRDLGRDLARRLGDAHELADWETERGREMDLYNNSAGRVIFMILDQDNLGRGHLSTEGLVLSVLKALRSGYLKQIAGDTLIPTR